MIGPLPYIGGKNRLATRIISLLPEHTTYVEPFAGGAQVLFHKPPSNVEVLNDLDFDIVNFFRVCQWHYEELVRYLRYCLASRKLHELHLTANPSTLTDIQRAGRFFYLQKNSFGGLVVKQKFHYGVTQPSNYNPERIPEIIEQAHRRLARVQIESLPYEQILLKYDRPTTFFYLDPPYWERRLYRHNFTEVDFIGLERHLHEVKGKFLLSLDDHPEVRKLFQHWHLMPVDIAYTAQRDVGKRFAELFITNFAE
ncbi:DNA adenine methylase [Paludibaculum fermentans]|uniref:DNA adenine methylase n=1 Tax=Paludibaculum fermentans TaxID=1473598 RepID=UPI003EBD398D